MKLQWFDDGEAALTSLGSIYNYAIIAEVRGQRVWRCEQTWMMADGHVTLLKGAWAADSVAAQDMCQTWEDNSEQAPDRSRGAKYRAAAAATRERRRALQDRTTHV
jgi:hypothetical protein